MTVDVRHGEWLDVLRHSLLANARMAAPATADYHKVYATACSNGLVGAADVDAVCDLLRSSSSYRMAQRHPHGGMSTADVRPSRAQSWAISW